MEVFTRLILFVLTSVIYTPPCLSKDNCTKVLCWVRSNVDFCLICKYNTHTQGTIDLMKQYLEIFHQLKYVLSYFLFEKTVKKTIAELLPKKHRQLKIKAQDNSSHFNPTDQPIDNWYDVDS